MLPSTGDGVVLEMRAIPSQSEEVLSSSVRAQQNSESQHEGRNRAVHSVLSMGMFLCQWAGTIVVVICDMVIW